jgi:hypothetical protein
MLKPMLMILSNFVYTWLHLERKIVENILYVVENSDIP